MDFKTTEASEDLGGLVRSITESVVTPERQKELDKLDERFDRELWDKLIDSDILSTTAPAASPNIVAQGDGDSITCTVHVDDELKDTRTSTGVHAQTFCLVKSA